MKKKILMAFLVTAMTVSVFTGCGNRMEGDGKVQAAMADAGNSQEENSDVPESEANEAESPEQTPEPTVEPTPEATAEPTAEPASETVNTTEAGTADGSSENTAVKDEETGYSFTEMNETMYAKCSVNLRDLPTTDNSEKIGKLTGGQEVKVTGQCVETQWYRIELEDETVAYVSNSYIVKDKSQVAGSSSGTTTGSSKTGNATQSTQSGSAGQSTSQGSGAKTASEQTQQSSTSSGTSQDFINYLNQQRAAAGLTQLTWDSGLASSAQSRAKEISTQYEHTDMIGGTALECILGSLSSSSTDWYNTWNASEGHRLAMFNDTITTGACAFYEVDGLYYVVFLGGGMQANVQSAEEWNATKDEAVASGEMEKFETTNVEGDSVTVYTSPNVTESNDEAADAAGDELLRQMGLIP